MELIQYQPSSYRPSSYLNFSKCSGSPKSKIFIKFNKYNQNIIFKILSYHHRNIISEEEKEAHTIHFSFALYQESYYSYFSHPYSKVEPKFQPKKPDLAYLLLEYLNIL